MKMSDNAERYCSTTAIVCPSGDHGFGKSQVLAWSNLLEAGSSDRWNQKEIERATFLF